MPSIFQNLFVWKKSVFQPVENLCMEREPSPLKAAFIMAPAEGAVPRQRSDIS